jgi:hypothetical protein
MGVRKSLAREKVKKRLLSFLMQTVEELSDDFIERDTIVQSALEDSVANMSDIGTQYLKDKLAAKFPSLQSQTDTQFFDAIADGTIFDPKCDKDLDPLLEAIYVKARTLGNAQEFMQLSFLDRADVLLDFATLMNMNSRGWEDAISTPFDVLLSLIQCAVDEVDDHELIAFDDKVVSTFRAVAKQIDMIPFKADNCRALIFQSGNLVDGCVSDNTLFNEAVSFLRKLWTVYRHQSHETIQELRAHAEQYNSSEMYARSLAEIDSVIRFMDHELGLRENGDSHVTAELTIEAYDDFIDMLGRKDRNLSRGVDVDVGMTHGAEQGIGFHAWCRMKAQHKILVDENDIEGAIDYLAFVETRASVHLKRLLPEWREAMEAALRGFLDQAYETMYTNAEELKPNEASLPQRPVEGAVKRGLLSTTSLSLSTQPEGLGKLDSLPALGL